MLEAVDDESGMHISAGAVDVAAALDLDESGGIRVGVRVRGWDWRSKMGSGTLRTRSCILVRLTFIARISCGFQADEAEKSEHRHEGSGNGARVVHTRARVPDAGARPRAGTVSLVISLLCKSATMIFNESSGSPLASLDAWPASQQQCHGESPPLALREEFLLCVGPLVVLELTLKD